MIVIPKIQQRDFYFGSALSMFFKHNQDTHTKGIEEKKAMELIKNGFLIGNLDIKEQERQKIKEIIGGE